MAAEGVEGQATVHIQAPPEKVYAMISDVTRMGEWSPETYRCEWIDGAAGPTAGARFKGSNKRGILRWSTKPTVTVADAGNEFTFEVGAPGKEDTRWSYKLTPKEGGTDLTESFESLRYTLKRVPSTRISLPSIVTRNGRASSCTTSNSVIRSYVAGMPCVTSRSSWRTRSSSPAARAFTVAAAIAGP